jgi:cytochrome c551/c552
MTASPSPEHQQRPKTRRTAAWPVYLAGGLLAIFTVIFAVEFINLSNRPVPAREPVAATLTAQTYAGTVEGLLAVADPERAPKLMETHACYGCHLYGALNRLGPSFQGIGARAAERRPPLSAAAYLYEAIVYPDAHTIEGYTGRMPLNFGALSDEDLGAIIAYLLTQ